MEGEFLRNDAPILGTFLPEYPSVPEIYPSTSLGDPRSLKIHLLMLLQVRLSLSGEGGLQKDTL